MPGGRPTDYDPVYCERVVETCAEGFSLTGFAGKIGVARSTLTEWAAKYPEFSIAVQRAKAATAAWWEERGRQVAKDGGPGGQSTMVIFGLKNHAPDDYREKQEHEITGKDGKDLIPAEADPRKLALALHAIVAGKGEEPKE